MTPTCQVCNGEVIGHYGRGVHCWVRVDEDTISRIVFTVYDFDGLGGVLEPGFQFTWNMMLPNKITPGHDPEALDLPRLGTNESERNGIRLAALAIAAWDVCSICGGRSLGLPGLTGPNEASNYVHGDKLCAASNIWSRITFEFGPLDRCEIRRNAKGQSCDTPK